MASSLIRTIASKRLSPFPARQMRSLSSLPLSIRPSEEEVGAGRLYWHNLQVATRALHRDGLLVIEDVLPRGGLDKLNKRMVSDAVHLRSLPEGSPFNYNKGNIQQDPLLTKEYFSPSIFLNPIARQVIHSVIGPRSRLSFISANAAMPPTGDSPPQSQPVHSDADFKHPDCPFAIVVNIPLVDMTPENGTTEVWLGTHDPMNEDAQGLNAQEGAHGERASGRIKETLLESRRAKRPPCQPVIKKGSIVLRDLRLWHAGKPNFTSDVRVMLAMIYFAGWFRNPMYVEFDQELREVVESHTEDLQVHAKYLPKDELMGRYLKRGFGNSYDFNQIDKLDGLFS